MDLSKLNTTAASDIPRACSLVNPFTHELLLDDEGRTADIFVYGMKSTAARNANAARSRKAKANLSDEESAKLGAEFLADLTVRWSDNIELGGERLEFNRQNAIRMYLEQDWVAEQVLRFVVEIENFDPKRQAS